MMQGVYFESHGKLKDVLKFGTIPKPVENELAPGEMIIQVNAGALNPADYKSAEGEQKLLLNFEWPRQYGFDFSGTVVAINALDTFQVCIHNCSQSWHYVTYSSSRNKEHSCGGKVTSPDIF